MGTTALPVDPLYLVHLDHSARRHVGVLGRSVAAAGARPGHGIHCWTECGGPYSLLDE